MTIERRTALLAGMAAVASPFVPARRAMAQALSPAAQAPGFYRFKVGAFEAVTVNDGFFTRPLAGLIRNADPAAIEAAAAEGFLPTSPMPIPFTVTFLRTPGGVIAFDTGTGVGMNPTSGLLHANLRAAGIEPAQVSLVCVSHFHPDHINGLLGEADAPVFANAELRVPAAEWGWWTDEGNAARTPEGQRANFANTRRRFARYEGKVRPFEDGAELAPGVRAVAGAGHTPGHSCFHVADGGAQLLVLGDLANRPELFLRHPGWHAVFDIDGAAAEASRRRVLDRAATDRIRVAGYHFPFPANGHVARAGEGYRFVPAEWSSTL